MARLRTRLRTDWRTCLAGMLDCRTLDTGTACTNHFNKMSQLSALTSLFSKEKSKFYSFPAWTLSPGLLDVAVGAVPSEIFMTGTMGHKNSVQSEKSLMPLELVLKGKLAFLAS